MTQGYKIKEEDLRRKKLYAEHKVNIHLAPMPAVRKLPLHTLSHACFHQNHQETDSSEKTCPESDQHKEANC